MIDEINKQIKANNDVVAERRSSKSKCKLEIMQHLAFLLATEVKSYHDEVARLKKEIDAITTHGQQLRKDITALTTEISELNKHNANTEAAIDSINKILRDSGFQGFSLRAKDGVENVYEVIREDGSVAENLSEGERNFIAFLYFYHQVRGSMTSEELKEKIVVIDDPGVQYGQYRLVPRQRHRPRNDQCLPEQYGISESEGTGRLYQAAVYPDA